MHDRLKQLKSCYEEHASRCAVKQESAEYQAMMANMAMEMCCVEKMLQHKEMPKQSMELTPEQEKSWVKSMENADGTLGAHWTMEQTTAVAKQNGVAFEHISEIDWWVAMNVAYSDFYANPKEMPLSTDVAIKYYVHIAKGILFDKDGAPPKQRLAGWSHTMR